LLEADRWRKGREWEYDKVVSACLSCGNGCSITVSTKDGEIVKINSAVAEGSIEKYICAIGRYGFDSLSSETRLKMPMKRVNGELQETTWVDAFETVAAKLKAAGSDAAFITSANILNEDAIVLKKLAAEAVKTKNFDSSVTLYSDYDAMKTGTADLQKADLFVLVGMAPDQWARVLPALDAVIRKRVNEAGAKLLVINAGEPRISSAATQTLRGDEVGMLQQLAQAVIAKGIKAPKEMVEALAHIDPSDAAMAAADLFIAAKSPVILASPSLYKAAANLSLVKGDAVSVPYEGNAKGVVLMGLTSEGRKFKDILISQTKVLYAIGEVPVSKRPDTDFLIVQSSHLTDLAREADVVLPATPALESEGTIIDYLGRLKEVKRAVEPAGESISHADIFIGLAGAMGVSLKKAKDTDVKKALKTKAKATFNPFKKEKDLDIDVEKFTEDINRSAINGSRLLWLKETEKGVAA
jgi:predicted molibdopterin-dependent oxidoreductase YjgC